MEWVPFGQAKQAKSSTARKVPAAQGEQALDPTLLSYPLGHLLHSMPVPSAKLLRLHLVHILLSGDKLASLMTAPAPQSKHLPPLEYSLSLQFEQLVDPATDFSPAGHPTHAVWPVLFWNVFARHFTQEDAPRLSECSPTAQGVHEVLNDANAW
jgi:hypothetical protein